MYFYLRVFVYLDTRGSDNNVTGLWNMQFMVWKAGYLYQIFTALINNVVAYVFT